ncbi:MAG: hypothetical protein HY597_07000 [Candidatus Omnitrophica bacterium]|nr:hypothetical protein [Candidatus Omnitrophota bacterium]
MKVTLPQPIDLTEILRPYAGEWVALSQDEKRVLGHGKTLDEALAGVPLPRQAKPFSEGTPMIRYVPEAAGYFFV